MRQRKNACVLLLILLFSSLSAVWTPLKAQYSMGTTGLMNIPTADMQPDGTFMEVEILCLLLFCHPNGIIIPVITS